MATPARKTIGDRMLDRIRLVVINVFILINLAATLVWLLPREVVSNTLLYPVGRYFYFTGQWQRWGVFAPVPPMRNVAVVGFVEYMDGSKTEMQFPRCSQMNVFGAFASTRYREYQTNVVEKRYLWQDTGAWLVPWYGDPEKKPKLAALVLLSREIPPPSADDYQPPLPREYDKPFQAYTRYLVP
jgi:hypothetical protein